MARMPYYKRLFLLIIFTSLVACGGNDGGNNGENEIIDNRPAVPITFDGLMAGDSDSLAFNMLRSHRIASGAPISEVSTIASGEQLVRTRLLIGFDKSASVSQINALLQDINAEILVMVEGAAQLAVRIPDPGDVANLESLETQLEANPLVRYVVKGYLPKAKKLPDNYDLNNQTGSNSLTKIDHHLAVGGHALWNTASAIPSSQDSVLVGSARRAKPLLMIGDHFGQRGLSSHFNVNILDSTNFRDNANFNDHGYAVLGVISGRHSDIGNIGDRDLVTGIYPDTLDLRVVDFDLDNIDIFTAFELNEILVLAMRFHVEQKPQQKIVLNTSSSMNCSVDLDDCKDTARAWVEMVKGNSPFGPALDLESKFIHIVPAGNIENDPSAVNALLDNEYALASVQYQAATNEILTDEPLANIILVENRLNTLGFDEAPPKPGCLMDSSKYNGDISAIGGFVWTFDGPVTGASGGLLQSGTSLAAPQVAGVAANMWTLKPDLNAYELKFLLLDAAQSPGNVDRLLPDCNTDGGIQGAKVLDAYASVLAVDDEAVLIGTAPAEFAPARLALLDVAAGADLPGNDGSFNEHDIKLYVEKLNAADGALDYSRYDLNGDAYTGGPTQARFNLNMSHENLSATYNSASFEMDGKTLALDENAVTDLQVLCYYAYSNLYSGDATERDNVMLPLQGQCEGDDLSILFYSFEPATNRASLKSISSTGANFLDLQVTLISLSPEFAGRSIDGEKIVYIQDDQSRNVMIMDNDGSNKQLVTAAFDRQTTNQSAIAVLISPTLDKIAIVSQSNSPEGVARNLYTVNLDGSGLTNVSNFPPYRLPTTGDTGILVDNNYLQWAPDGSKIAFIGQKTHYNTTTFQTTYAGDLYIVNVDGSGLQKLTDNPLLPAPANPIELPTWSPDSNKIAYDTGLHELFYYDLQTNNNIPVVSNPNAQVNGRSIRWSLNSDQFFFIGLLALGDSSGLHRYDLADANIVPLMSNNDIQVQVLNMSPDGKRLIYSEYEKTFPFTNRLIQSDSNGQGRIILYESVDSTPTTPRVSPDSNKIAFQVYSPNGRRDIYTVFADGNGLSNITESYTGEISHAHFIWSYEP